LQYFFGDDMKRILAATFLTTFMLTSAFMPAQAIMDKNSKQIKKQLENTQSILSTINYDWWKSANDSYLEDYILRAVQNNYDIKLAQLRVEQAQINVMAVRSDQLPTLTIGAAPGLAKMPNTTKTMGSVAFPVIAQYELDIFGKNWDKTKSSKTLLKGVEYQTMASDIAIISFVATTYYNIVKLDKIIELQEKITQDRKEISRLMNLSNKEGLVSTQDTIQAEKSYIMAQNDLIEYQKSLANALNALAVLIGDSPNNVNEYKRISYDELSSDFEIPNEISSDVITNRPDYKSLEQQLKAAGIDVRVAKKEFLPTIDILGLAAFIATSTASNINWKNAAALAGGGAMLPLFTGFKKTANLKFNKNKYNQILQQYQKTGLTAIQEVNDSLYNYKSDSEKLLNNIKAFDMQNEDFKLANAKYREGVISKLDLLQQREVLLFTEQLTVNSKISCYIDKISLYKTTGAKI